MAEIDWRTLIRRIKSGKFTPLVSDRVFFPGRNSIRAEWSAEIGYPFTDPVRLTLPRIAQYLSAISRDDLAVKEDFLDFSKRYLLKQLRETADDERQNFLDRVEDELLDITFSETAGRLDYPKYDNDLENPLFILASLPIPIYITTSYYDFIERELIRVGKSPRSEVCYWHDDLQDVPSVFQQNPEYEPSEQEPLVYHLNGLDKFPTSMVLTEDDYLDFLVRVAQDLEVVPRRISQALVDSSLLLLGYKLEDWNFKTMFRGLISSKRDSRRRLSVSIQIPAETGEDAAEGQKEVADFLAKYFTKANFDVYWGTAEQFMQTLWQEWEKA